MPTKKGRRGPLVGLAEDVARRAGLADLVYVDPADGARFRGRTVKGVVRALARAAWMEKDGKGPYMREVVWRCREARPTAPAIDPTTAATFLASLVAAGFLMREG